VRGLFFALLFLNVAFFGWTHWIAAPAAAAAAVPAQASSLPMLALVNPSASGASPQGTRCRTLGPFADMAGALAVAGTLREQGLVPRDRSVDTSVQDGYWVYIDQIKDQASQRGVLARLGRAGIHDAAAMTGPGQADRISVGVFTDQAHAVRRAEQVRQLGFMPVLDLHQHTLSAHWLDMDLKPNQPEPALQALQAESSQTTGAAPAAQPAIAFSDCPASDTGG